MFYFLMFIFVIFMIVMIVIGESKNSDRRKINSFREKVANLNIGDDVDTIQNILGKPNAVSKNIDATTYTYICYKFKVEVVVNDSGIIAINELV